MLLAKMYGASISDDFSCLTHFVIPKDTRSEDLEAYKIKVNAKIVSTEWLQMCFRNKRLVNELEYLM